MIDDETVLQVRDVLAQLVSDITDGSRREPDTIARDLATLAAVLLPVYDMKAWLNPVDVSVTDHFLDMVVKARLGPWP